MVSRPCTVALENWPLLPKLSMKASLPGKDGARLEQLFVCHMATTCRETHTDSRCPDSINDVSLNWSPRTLITTHPTFPWDSLPKHPLHGPHCQCPLDAAAPRVSAIAPTCLEWAPCEAVGSDNLIDPFQNSPTFKCTHSAISGPCPTADTPLAGSGMSRQNCHDTPEDVSETRPPPLPLNLHEGCGFATPKPGKLSNLAPASHAPRDFPGPPMCFWDTVQCIAHLPVHQLRGCPGASPHSTVAGGHCSRCSGPRHGAFPPQGRVEEV